MDASIGIAARHAGSRSAGNSREVSPQSRESSPTPTGIAVPHVAVQSPVDAHAAAVDVDVSGIGIAVRHGAIRAVGGEGSPLTQSMATPPLPVSALSLVLSGTDTPVSPPPVLSSASPSLAPARD
jgi:hypothetical protein